MQDDNLLPSGITPPEDWFALEQFRALQRQADECRRELGRVEKLCIGGVVAAFIWLARDADLYSDSAALVWYLPVVVAFYGALKSQSVEARLSLIGDAIERIRLSRGAASEGMQPRAHPRGVRLRWLMRRAAWVAFVALTAGASTVGFEGVPLLGEEDDGSAEQTTTAVVSWLQSARAALPARAL
jgi:hypothetical protein